MIPVFDAIIEGRNPTDPQGLTFKIATLGIPQGAASLMDRRAIYPLVGRLFNYGKTFQQEKPSGRQMLTVDSLSTCDGLTLRYDGTFGAYLEEPRSVFLLDGRVFSKMGENEFYMQMQIPQALEVNRQLFEDKHLNEIYLSRFIDI